MKLRELRHADGPRLFALLKSEFPEEEAILGMRPEGFEAILRRLYRADVRFVLGLLRLVRRSPFHLYVLDDGRTIVATTLLSFTARAGFLSTVVVAPEARRHGYARQLIERARAETARRGRPYVVLRVLEGNAPARALYASAGYAELGRERFAVHESPASLRGYPEERSVRPFRPDDAGRLAEIANAGRPELWREVLPVRPQDLHSRTFADRVFAAQTAAWVVDRGRGPEGFVAASSSPATEAAHLSTPILGPQLEPAHAAGLLRTAGAWLADRSPVRVVTSVAESDRPARAALQEVGFHEGIADLALYRPSR